MGINYFRVARENEHVFRNVLRDLKNNRAQRPMGICIPEDLETEVPLEVIFEKYSRSIRYGRFTVTNFVINGRSVSIAFENVAMLSGGGASLLYAMNDNDGGVEYRERKYMFLS